MEPLSGTPATRTLSPGLATVTLAASLAQVHGCFHSTISKYCLVSFLYLKSLQWFSEIALHLLN